MRYRNLLVAAALVAVVSTAQAQNVTTADGEIVMLEKQQAQTSGPTTGVNAAPPVPPAPNGYLIDQMPYSRTVFAGAVAILVLGVGGGS